MYRSIITALILVLVSISSYAHEMVPTYPKWQQSYMDDLLITHMEMFNKRADVQYYEIGVFDENWNTIPFVSSYNVLKIDYLSKIKFDVYIRKADKDRAAYICSRSRLPEIHINTGVSSTICSKFVGDE